MAIAEQCWNVELYTLAEQPDSAVLKDILTGLLKDPSFKESFSQDKWNTTERWSHFPQLVIFLSYGYNSKERSEKRPVFVSILIPSTEQETDQFVPKQKL